MSVRSPRCLANSTRKDGFGADHRPNLRCTTCGTSFRDSYRYRARQAWADAIIRFHQMGKSIREIAVKLKVGKNTVHRHVQQWRSDVKAWRMSHRCLFADGAWRAGKRLPAAKLTVLNFGGGTASSLLLEAVLREELDSPSPFLVVFADPGMEKRRTYQLVSEMETRFCQAGIPFVRAPGPNLYRDILAVRRGKKRRLDNPPYFVKKENGQKGRLRQACTAHYKIAPIDRAIRKELSRRYGIHPRAGNLGLGTV